MGVIEKFVPEGKEAKFTVVTEETMPVEIQPVVKTVTKEIIRENFPDQPVKVEETKIKQESGCTKMQVVFTNEVTHEQTVATVVTGSQGTVIEEVKPHIAVRPAVMPIM